MRGPSEMSKGKLKGHLNVFRVISFLGFAKIDNCRIQAKQILLDFLLS